MSFGSLARVGCRFSEGWPSLEPERGPSLEPQDDHGSLARVGSPFSDDLPSLEPERGPSLESVENGLEHLWVQRDVRGNHPEQAAPRRRTVEEAARQVHRLVVTADLSDFRMANNGDWVRYRCFNRLM
jgi:hypothetical protein